MHNLYGFLRKASDFTKSIIAHICEALGHLVVVAGGLLKARSPYWGNIVS